MTVQTRATPASWLPLTATSFVGRRHEAAQTRQMLGNERIVTLLGPGGVGKTRLALHVAGELRRVYADGVWLVELADVRDGSLFAQSLAERLGAQDQSRGAIEAVTSYLTHRQLLLVLDNCEHLIDECAQTVAHLIKSCPDLRVLATSRQSLGIAGEATLSLPPLSAPDVEVEPSVEEALRFESVRLFAERARAILPSFELHVGNAIQVARLCRRLDGLPLAIELAAVRVRALTLAQIEERLASRYQLLTSGDRAAPPRQQTLQALVDWSYQLCTDEERLMWARMSVFSGGFTLDAAERVCSGQGLAPADVLDVLDALVDKSLVVAERHGDELRFRVLETIREYGAERLAESGEGDVVRGRHRDWCADLTRRFANSWVGPRQVEWIARLRREHPNLRVALNTCLEGPGDPRSALEILSKIEDYWAIRGLYAELRYWLDRALALADQPSAQRFASLRMAGWSALLQEDVEAGLSLMEEAAQVVGAVGGPSDKPLVTHLSGLVAVFAGDLKHAATSAEFALEGFRKAGDRRGELLSLFLLGLARGLSGDRDRGLALLEETIAASMRAKELYWRGWALWAVCVIEADSGHLARADATGKEALTLHRKLDNRLAMAVNIEALAWVATEEGRHSRAAALFGITHRISSEVGTDPSTIYRLGTSHDEHVRSARTALGDEAYDNAFGEGRSLPDDAAFDLALELAPDRLPEHKAARTTARGPLTRRELEVAELVALGLSNKDVAARLVLSPRTAAGHVENVLRKLGFRSRAQIATWVAQQEGRDAP